MSNYWNPYKFSPGKIYYIKGVAKYFRFVYSEMVMESFVRYTFTVCDESTDVSFKETDEILKKFKLAEPAAQVLYGKEHTKSIR